MAEFSKLVVTASGRELITQILESDQKIKFTKAATSSTEYGLEILKDLSKLENVKQWGSVSDIEAEGTDTIKVNALIPNYGLEQGYYLKTVGLYAESANGQEILYGAAVETSQNGCYVPPFENRTVSNLYFSFSVAVGNAEKVILDIDPSALVTIKQWNKLLFPQYQEAESLQRMQSGESFFTAVGKAAKAVSDFIRHKKTANCMEMESTVDQIIVGIYEDSPDGEGNPATAEEIDSIISGSYADTADTGGDLALADDIDRILSDRYVKDPEEDGQLATYEEIAAIVARAF